MRKALLVLAGLMLLATTAFAQTYKEAIDAGVAKLKKADYVGAREDFQTALKLAKTGIEKAGAQYEIGYCYLWEKNYPAARAEFAKVLAIADGLSYHKSAAQVDIGRCYEGEKNYPVARAAFAGVLAMVKGHPLHKAFAQLHIGLCYEAEGKIAEAQEAFCKLCLEYASTNDVYHLRQGFNKINAGKIGKAKYLEVLNALILGIKATPENAEFLGLLKSEIEKLK